MLLVLDVKMVEYFLLFSLHDVGVVVLSLETSFPCLDFCFLLLDQFDKTFIFIYKVRVLSKQYLNLLFKFIHAIQLTSQEHDFFIKGMHFTF